MGFISRLPYSSSWAYGPKTLVRSTLAREPSGCRACGSVAEGSTLWIFSCLPVLLMVGVVLTGGD